MKKIRTILMISFLVFLLPACNKNETTSAITSSNFSTSDKIMNKNLTLTIDNTKVDVTWLDNESTNELKKLATVGLDLGLLNHGDFEQYGPIGTTISSNDKRITTSPGDIVLYSSNQIVLFYGSNTWEYTRLGHINLSEDELVKLLDKPTVNILLSLE